MPNTAPTHTSELPDFVHVGAYVSWRTWCGDCVTVEVWHVDKFTVSYQYSSGCIASARATCFESLADAVAAWRAATALEVDAFRTRAKPWRPID